MDLSPEEYGAYWGGSLRIAAGILVGLAGWAFVQPFLAIEQTGPRALGAVLLIGIVVVATFLAVLGVARVIRAAVDAEMRG